MRDTNSTVELSMTGVSTTNARDATITEIRVTDYASGVGIVTIQLTSEQVLAALRGRFLSNVPAWVVPDEFRDLLGKEREHLEVRTEFRGGLVSDEAKAVAAVKESHPGWDEYAARRHNYGLSVHLTRWVEPGANDGD